MSFRPTPVHASVAVTTVVMLKSFEMSYAALVGLAVRNHVEADLASNVPLAVEGLTVGAIIATTQFRAKSGSWWYASGLFVVMSLVSVTGNVEYAREIGGGTVSCAIHGGMPLILLCSVHLTMMLWNQGRKSRAARSSDDHAGTSLIAVPNEIAPTSAFPAPPAVEVVGRASFA